MELCEKGKQLAEQTCKKIKELDPGASLVSSGNTHITLCFLGELSESQVEEKRAAFRKLTFKPFNYSLGKTGFFPNNKFIRVVWLSAQSNGKIEQLHEKTRGLIATGTKAEKEKQFTAHATIARIKSPKNTGAMRALTTSLNQTVECQAQKATLKQTTFEQKKAVYNDLETVTAS